MSSPSTATPPAAPAPKANLDAVGIFWVVWTCTWTLCLFAGMAFLYSKRSMPILRVRGLALSFAAILWLHGYWMAVELAYTYGPLMPNGVEFWVMGIWLPFGVALFNASNSRFLHVAAAQEQFASTAQPVLRRIGLRPARKLSFSSKMLLLISAGMGFQVRLFPPLSQSVIAGAGPGKAP